MQETKFYVYNETNYKKSTHIDKPGMKCTKINMVVLRVENDECCLHVLELSVILLNYFHE